MAWLAPRDNTGNGVLQCVGIGQFGLQDLGFLVVLYSDWEFVVFVGGVVEVVPSFGGFGDVFVDFDVDCFPKLILARPSLPWTLR